MFLLSTGRRPQYEYLHSPSWFPKSRPLDANGLFVVSYLLPGRSHRPGHRPGCCYIAGRFHSPLHYTRIAEKVKGFCRIRAMIAVPPAGDRVSPNFCLWP